MPSILNDSVSKVKSLFQKPWEWRIGVALIAGFLVARGLGLFSSLELTTLDFFLRHRLPEEEDQHTVIVLVDEAQFQTDQTSAEKYLADLIEIIFVNKPTVVGLNIFMREPDDYAARSRLISLFKNYDNLIGVQKVFPPEETLPPEEILETTTEKQFGINDVPLDRDSKIRRVFVGSYLPDVTPETSNDNPFV
ncbi:MAG: CHASE2 domain-containing protein, partial [Cyanobacteria bacterium J06559_3]